MGQMKRIGVISGHYPGSEFASAANHRVYCERHGYTYINCNWPTGSANPYFNKVEFLRHYLEAFDVLFWIDDDAFFLDLDRSLHSILPQEPAFLSICSSPDYKAISTPISSGQFALCANERGRAFLDRVSETNLSEVRDWWTEDLGFFSHGDQDAMYFVLQTVDEFADGATVHPYQSFNSRAENLEDVAPHDVFILHFTGTKDVKKRNYRHVQALRGCGPSLLPRSVDREWRVVAPPTLALRLRRAVGRLVGRARRVLRH